MQIRQVLKRRGHCHDLEGRARRIQPLRHAVDQRAGLLVAQCAFHVRRVKLRHGDHRQNLAGFIIEHDGRAALTRGELLADIAGEALGDGQLQVVPALRRAGKGVAQPLEHARLEAEQVLRMEGIHARGDLPAAVAHHLRHRHAGVSVPVVEALAVLAGAGQHGAVPVGDRAHDHVLLLAADARVVRIGHPSPAVEIHRIAAVYRHRAEEHETQNHQQMDSPSDYLDSRSPPGSRFLIPSPVTPHP